MCSRYVLSLNSFVLEKQFGWAVEGAFDGSNNIAPSETVIALRQISKDNLVFQTKKWGYNTGWNSGPKFIINLKSETILEKKFAIHAATHQRCILPANGFIEWITNSDRSKTPVLFERADQQLFGLAGIIFTNNKKEEECVVLTTNANECVLKVHDRMPVMINSSHWQEWIEETDANSVFKNLAKPFSAAAMQATSLDPAINNARNKNAIIRMSVL